MVVVLGCTGEIVGDRTEGGAAPNNNVTPAGPVDVLTGNGPDSSCERPLLPTPIRRLNHSEYATTLQALFGDSGSHVDSFPADGAVAGYKTVGEGLTFSDALVDGYWETAQELASGAALACQPGKAEADCARQLLADLALSAWRRPLTDTDAAELLQIVSDAQSAGDSFEVSLQTAVRALLMSPNFVFRLPPDAAQPAATSYAIAERLSYALWNGPPDATLFDAAASERLLEPAERAAQVSRMLSDPRAKRFAREFSSQWLDTEKLSGLSRDEEMYPEFSSLIEPMGEESILFFQSFMDSPRSVRDLIDARESFVNEALADHYGISGVSGDAMQSARIPLERVGGILGQGTFLSVTSGPSHTAPVKRGQFVLDRLLCSPTPPPPPGADVMGGPVDETASKREQLAQHRESPACAACHDRMDPIGLAFDNYGATGELRDTDDFGYAVDVSGELPGYGAFTGPEELLALIKNSEELTLCLTRQLLTYSLGRRVTSEDSCAVEQITLAAAQEGESLGAVVSQVIESDTFLQTISGSSNH